MMKWKSKHRQGDSSQSTATFPAPDVHELLPQFPESIISPLAPSFVDVGVDLSPETTPKQSPRLTQLIITEDIEALLEEDRRVRALAGESEAEQLSPDPIAPFGDPNSVIRGLPPPPRKLQSGRKMPASAQSGRASHLVGDHIAHSVRPSTTGGATSFPSVSIMDVRTESAASKRTDPMDPYTMHKTVSADEPKLSNRLSDFGPKSPRRSLDSMRRQSFGAESYLSSTTLHTNAAASSSTFTDASRTAQLPSRPLLSHAPRSSRESVYSTVSSCDPPSTIHESRISVSSTVYPSSNYDELPSPVARIVADEQYAVGSRVSLSHSEVDSVHVEDQQQSIVDTSTHTSPEYETPVPQRTAHVGPVGIHPIRKSSIGSTGRIHPPRPLSSASDISLRSTSGQKPALPTTPKPDFRRSRSVQPPSKTPMISKPPSPSSPKLPGLIPYHLLTSFPSPDSNRSDSLPPTTNYLNPQERAELIRKTRKLTQVFGETPSPMTGSDEHLDSPALNNCLLPVIPSRKAHARGIMSVSDALNMSSVSKSLREPPLSTISPDRTTSLSPIRFRSSSSGLGNESDGSLSPFDSPETTTPMSSRKKGGDASIRSPTIISTSDSFIEMAGHVTPNMIRFPSSYSFVESMTDEQQAEEERRRKREKLAKLHRFLGSRVPLELVLGPGIGAPLPPLAQDPLQADAAANSDGELSSRLWLLGKRRNSLASSDPLERLADSERRKEELSEKEKAIVVKRALKMGKLFGEQPPQDLFHSSQVRSASSPAGKVVSQSKLPVKSAPSSPVGGNAAKLPYRKEKSKRNSRPGTAESSKRLLGSSWECGDTESINDGQSDVYYHYRNSLVSLRNIVDNDDRRSLVELHEYINEDLSSGGRDKRESLSSSSIRSERRRSLPLRASHASLSSQYTISEVKAEITPFEVRRRRATKLSHFFGVSYRDLFGEVIDSLEMSVREDEGKGTLNADEAKDLLVQLTKLKARQEELS